MSSEVHSINEYYKPKSNSNSNSNSTLSKLRKAQSTPKLRLINNNTANTTTKEIKSSTSNNNLQSHNHHHFNPLKKKKRNTPITSYQTVIDSQVSSTNSKNYSTSNKPLPASPTSPTSPTTSSSFFKKISNEWNSFLKKIRSISEEVFDVDDLIEELFVDSDSDNNLNSSYTSIDKFMKSTNNNNNSTEERFLQDYKKFKNLDNMYSYYNQSPPSQQAQQTNQPQSGSNDVGSSTTVVSDQQSSFNIRSTLQDVIRHHQNQFNSNYLNLDSISSDSDSINDLERESDGEENDTGGEDDEDLITATGSSNDDIQFNDIDFTILRTEFETMLASQSSSTSQQSPSQIDKNFISNNSINQINVGTTLWNYRRSKWLISNKSNTEIKKRIVKNSINNKIPKDQYYKLYLLLIDKNKSLKSNKFINLKELIKLIHIGWITEKRWEQ
ncbi:uncharacterized protein KGF55_001966 [Candida pseudojiufengensis]|uniref:uncharacterized protein n=1 Tax=Candida pseudojiufengensis TaxID=497109 RepID=UPI0022248198|nr:uncharacterized protein KGF55_001966 [Candida pseudojiufengensis]KAI5964895.1 hypothetical protein KGF55_001966 [Candida pseudojiufengensis]